MIVIKLILGFLALIATGVYVFIFLDIAVVSIRLVKGKYKKAVKNKDIRKKIKKVLYKIFDENVAIIMIGNWIFYFIVAMIATIMFLLGFISFEALRAFWDYHQCFVC